MIIILLALVDIHTLLVLLFHEYMGTVWVLSGSTIAIMKGLMFYIPGRDLFSLLDIITGCIMLSLLVFGGLWNFLWWSIFIYLSVKIMLSFMAL